jgi:hypothetical protein
LAGYAAIGALAFCSGAIELAVASAAPKPQTHARPRAHSSEQAVRIAARPSQTHA